MSERILLTGASGLLGGAVLPELRPHGDVDAPGLDIFDLDRPETVERFVLDTRPSLVVHLAADARVDRCEEHPEDAFRTNVLGTAHLADACRRVRARIVMMSTDYVFDGAQGSPYREYQRTGALGIYGRSKEEAEKVLFAVAHDRLVVRSSSLFGTGGPNFVNAILDRARRGEPLEVVDDQVQSPTWVRHLAPALARAAVSEMQGIVHIAAAGSCTWYQLARAILDATGLRVPCSPISSDRSNRPAPRPRYSVLDCSLAAAGLGVALPSWKDGLAGYLREVKAAR